MSEPIALVSSARILPNELSAFAQEIGATLTPNDFFVARLSNQDRQVWFAISEEPIDEENHRDYLQALDAMPATVIILEISRTTGSMDLAAEFISKFAARWPAVVDTLDGWNSHIYAVTAFLDLYKKDK